MNVRITNTVPAGNVMAIHQEDGFVDITVAITAHQSIRKGHAMNNVLCFGDSNTFGTNPAKPGTRAPLQHTLDGTLAKLLGPEWRVIEEGMGGCTLSIRQPFGAAPFRVGGVSDHIAITSSSRLRGYHAGHQWPQGDLQRFITHYRGRRGNGCSCNLGWPLRKPRRRHIRNADIRELVRQDPRLFVSDVGGKVAGVASSELRLPR